MIDLVGMAVLYGVVGVGCAAAALVSGHAGDALLLLALWPLYGPFAIGRWTAGRPPTTSLGELLPDRETLAAIERQIEDARGRIDQIASHLARPEFRESEAEAHLARLEAEGALPAALASARSRLDNIRRLAAFKKRFERELEEGTELLIQATAQREVVRLVATDEPAGRELVRELAARIEGLDQVLAEEIEDPAWANRSASSSSTTRPTSAR